MKYDTTRCSVHNLLLDPDNYRFLDHRDYQQVSEKRCHEDAVQDKAYVFLRGSRPEELRTLKESILANGYVPLELLIVRQYDHKKGYFVIIEGNRRVAAMKWILDDYKSGVDIPKETIESFENLPIVIIDVNDPENEDAVPVLMGIRHVSGVRPWGAYQQAKLVSKVMDDFELPLQEAAAKLSMTTREANRRRRAYKALEQMQNDDEFGGTADPELYYKFHEAVGIPEVRDWLGWSESDFTFGNEDTRRQFYELITERFDEESNRPIAAKLQTREDVRNLRRILRDENAKAALLDPSKTLSEAVAIAMASESGGWTSQVRSAINAMDRLTAKDMKQVTESEMQLLETLRSMLDERMKDIKKLSAA